LGLKRRSLGRPIKYRFRHQMEMKIIKKRSKLKTLGKMQSTLMKILN
jgi:hypothetical protein